jgi:hypothetical protein
MALTATLIGISTACTWPSTQVCEQQGQMPCNCSLCDPKYDKQVPVAFESLSNTWRVRFLSLTPGPLRTYSQQDEIVLLALQYLRRMGYRYGALPATSSSTLQVLSLSP